MVLVLPVPGVLAQACGPREAVVAELEGQWGERRMAVAAVVGQPGQVAELWVNEGTGTATVTYTAVRLGLTCVMGAFEGWGPPAPVPEITPEPGATTPVPGTGQELRL